MAPIPRSALLARALRARTAPVRQSFNRLSRRSYASGHEQSHTAGSEIPWMLGAGAATAGGVWVLWPEPPKYGKGGHGHGEHHDEEEKEEEESSGEESKDETPEEESSSDDKESKDGEDEESKSDGNKEEKKDEASAEEASEDSEDDKEEPKKGTKENPIVDDDREDGNRMVKYQDAKGGNKKRLESKNAIKQGNKGDDPKGASANVHSGSGESVYNTDTKHSIDAQAHPDLSNKAEGDPETAKIKKPVDPFRPQK